MADLQERIAEMMGEIHDICEANGITYFLNESQALQAAVNHELDANVTSGKILMTAEDLKKFIDAFEASPVEGREIEYLGNNGYYPYFNLNYVDAGSVYYNMRRLSCERCLGIYVSISVLKPVTMRSKVHQAIEQTWERMAFDETVIGRKVGPIVAFRFRRSIAKEGRDKTAADLFEYLLEQYSDKSRRNEYWFTKKTGKKVTNHKIMLPAKRVTVDLYGHQLYALEMDKELFHARESRYKRKEKKEFNNNEMRFADTDISYKDLNLEQYRNSIRPMTVESASIKRRATRVRKRRRKYFNVLYRTHARYYYGLLFEKQIDELEKMLEEGRTDELEEIMDPYVKDLEKLKNIYIGKRVNRILEKHYGLDLEVLFNNLPEFYNEGIKIYDYKGNYIRTIAGSEYDD